MYWGPTNSQGNTVSVMEAVNAGTTLLGRIDQKYAIQTDASPSVGAVATGPNDVVYGTDMGSRDVFLWSPPSFTVTKIIAASYTPHGIAVDAATQHIYVSAAEQNAIYVYSLKVPYTLLSVISNRG